MTQTRQPSIKKNFIMNVLLTLSSIVFPLITFPYITRILLPAGTGRVGFATSVISYFNIFAQLGIPTYGIRAVARVRDDKEQLTQVCQELLIINLVMTVLAYIALIPALIYVPRLAESRALFIIISLSIVLNSIGMEWLYRGLEQYTYITVRSVFFKLIALAAMFLLVHQESDYLIYGAISIFAASASNIMNFIYAKRYIHFKPLKSYDFGRHIHPVFVFFAMSCATTVYTNLDTVMLGFMTSDADVGYYQAAVKIKGVMVGLVTSLGAVLLPRASYYIEHGELEEFYRIAKKALQFVFFIAVPVVVYFIVYAGFSIYTLSGKEFTGSIVPMQIIMPTVLFIGITNVTGIQILVPLGKEKYVLYSEIAGAVTDLILNWIFIPKMHAAGAALGTLVAELVVLIVQFVAMKSEIRELISDMPAVNTAIGIVCAVIASVWVLYRPWGNFVSLLVTGVLFFMVYFAAMIFRRDAMALYILRTLFRKFMRKKKTV